MPRPRKVRFVEPQGQPNRPMNPWITRWPLLGPITLATILENRGFDVAIYNENISGQVDQSDQHYQDVCSADVVCISIMTPTAARGYDIADAIRRDAPNAKIVIGGTHATFLPEEALAHCDIVIKGEAETIIEKVALGEVPDGITSSEPLADLDKIPTLNHFLMVDFDKVFGSAKKRHLYELPVMTSRGCPYGCTYCSVTQMFGHKVRRQSVEKVYRDILTHYENGFRQFFFYDDNFTSDRAWTRELLDRIRPLRIRFNAQARVDLHWVDGKRTKRDDEMLKHLRRSGCNLLFIGYETIDDATAKMWNKGYRSDRSVVDMLTEDTRILHDHGIWIHAMFVMGPQHTQSTGDAIVKFARKNEIESLQISVLTPFPGTPLFDEMKDQLLFNNFPADWNYFDAAHCVYDHGKLGAIGLQEAVFKTYSKFYSGSAWNVRAIRQLAARPISFREKIADMINGAQIAKTMLGHLRDEMDEFLDVVRERIDSRDN